MCTAVNEMRWSRDDADHRLATASVRVEGKGRGGKGRSVGNGVIARVRVRVRVWVWQLGRATDQPLGQPSPAQPGRTHTRSLPGHDQSSDLHTLNFIRTNLFIIRLILFVIRSILFVIRSILFVLRATLFVPHDSCHGVRKELRVHRQFLLVPLGRARTSVVCRRVRHLSMNHTVA